MSQLLNTNREQILQILKEHKEFFTRLYCVHHPFHIREVIDNSKILFLESDYSEVFFDDGDPWGTANLFGPINVPMGLLFNRNIDREKLDEFIRAEIDNEFHDEESLIDNYSNPVILKIDAELNKRIDNSHHKYFTPHPYDENRPKSAEYFEASEKELLKDIEILKKAETFTFKILTFDDFQEFVKSKDDVFGFNISLYETIHQFLKSHNIDFLKDILQFKYYEIPRKYDQYLNRFDFFRPKGKGFSQYNAISEDFQLFHEKLSEYKINYTEVKCSEILKTDSLDIRTLKGKDLIYLIQDIDFSELLHCSNVVVNKVIFPAFYNSIPLIFISISDQTKFNNIKIDSGLIHFDIPTVEKLLFTEQIERLLSLVNFNISSFYSSDNIENIFYTPIEIIIRNKLEENKISYEPQVKLGRHYVDFLVGENDKRIIVECDGRDYHDPDKDAERDKELEKFGFKMLRLSGSEIFSYPNQCLEKIKDGLHKNVRRKLINIEQDLDDSQRKAVKHISGPVRVLAPAGSGKTKVLINRIAEIINTGVDENKILALAFNRDAKDVMIDRLRGKGITVSERIDDYGVRVNTLHAFGYQLIMKFLKLRFDSDNADKFERQFMEDSIRKHHKDIPGYIINDAFDKFLKALHTAKMELQPIDTIEIEIEKKNESQIIDFKDVFYSYLKKQLDNNFINFVDMQYFALRLILDNQVVRKELQNTFEYVLVDEFQDLTMTQLMFAQVLALPKNNLFIVGDDDQMIYGWRGAQVSHIIDFNKRFINATTFTLSTNYRSSKQVISHSNWLIANNQFRVLKDTKPSNYAIFGEVSIAIENNLFNQSKKAVEWVKEKKEEGNYNWDQFAILTRQHAYKYLIAMLLDSNNIPHVPVETKGLYTLSPGRDLYAYLSVILHPNQAKTENYDRILRRPNKYIENDIIDRIKNWEDFLNLGDYFIEDWRKAEIVRFIDNIADIQSHLDTLDTPEKLINTIIQAFNLRKYYTNQTSTINDTEKASDENILDVILSVTKLYKTNEDFYGNLHLAINDIGKPTSINTINPNKLNEENKIKKVKISTVHSTKGMEFTNVVYLNLVKDDKVTELSIIEEERRVCYVGITRAIENILITSMQGKVSPFLCELAKNPDLQEKSNDEIKVLISREKGSLDNNKNHIKHLELTIDMKRNQYPELKGEKPLVDRNSLSILETRRIEKLKNKYPELTGGKHEVTIFLFKSYFTERRKRKIEEARSEIKMLEDKIQDTYNTALSERGLKVKTAINEINNLNDEILNSTKISIKIEENILELENELKFREILAPAIGK